MALARAGAEASAGEEAFQQRRSEDLATPQGVMIEAAAMQAALEWFWVLEPRGTHAWAHPRGVSCDGA